MARGAAPVTWGRGDSSVMAAPGSRCPGQWGEQPPVFGGVQIPGWGRVQIRGLGVQAPGVSVWAGSGLQLPVQQGQSPLAAPGQGRAGPRRHTPPSPGPCPHRVAGAGVSAPGLGVDGVGPVTLFFPLTEGLRIPTALPRPSEGRGVIQTGEVQARFTLSPAPLTTPLWIPPVLLLRIQPSSWSLMSSVASLRPKELSRGSCPSSSP